MRGQTIILRGEAQRRLACEMIASAPADAVINLREAGRTQSQNDKMWAMITDVSRAQPEGRMHTADVWKALFMSACGHAVQFVNGLDGQPFPTGLRSSALSKAEMRDLIECIYEYGARHDVQWSEPEPDWMKER